MANVPIPIKFQIFKGDQLVREEVLNEPVIKIGKLASSHLRLDDETVSRMHARRRGHRPGRDPAHRPRLDARDDGQRRANQQGGPASRVTRSVRRCARGRHALAPRPQRRMPTPAMAAVRHARAGATAGSGLPGRADHDAVSATAARRPRNSRRRSSSSRRPSRSSRRRQPQFAPPPAAAPAFAAPAIAGPAFAGHMAPRSRCSTAARRWRCRPSTVVWSPNTRHLTDPTGKTTAGQSKLFIAAPASRPSIVALATFFFAIVQGGQRSRSTRSSSPAAARPRTSSGRTRARCSTSWCSAG